MAQFFQPQKRLIRTLAIGKKNKAPSVTAPSFLIVDQLRIAVLRLSLTREVAFSGDSRWIFAGGYDPTEFIIEGLKESQYREDTGFRSRIPIRYSVNMLRFLREMRSPGFSHGA